MSGVGPKDHLTEKGIKVIADLPVGDNLQDPVAIDGLTFILEKPYSLLAARILSLPVVLNYTAYGGTQFSLLGGFEAVAFVTTKYGDTTIDWPDVQFHFAAGSDVTDCIIQNQIFRNVKLST